MSEVSQLKSQVNFLESQVSSLESTIDSLNESLRDKDTEMDRGEDARVDLKNDIEELNQNLQVQEEELYQNKRELHETSQELHEAQQKIAELMDNIDDLIKNQAVYIGHKNDPIDMQLAKYIQTFPEKEKMKILFIRETEGVYQFGQKRVYVKIEKGNNIKVRVGGGFMHIDDFIEQYTPLELEKIERHDVTARFQNKLQIQKITSDQAQGFVETSPIRSPQRPKSPNVRRKMSPGIRGNRSPGPANAKYKGSPHESTNSLAYSPTDRPQKSPGRKKRRSTIDQN